MGSFEKAAYEQGFKQGFREECDEQRNRDIMIIRLWRKGLSSEEIASQLELDLKDVSDFLIACKVPLNGA